MLGRVDNGQFNELLNELKVTYQQLMDACTSLVYENKALPYPGTLTEEEYDDLEGDIDYYDIYTSWADETGHEFKNNGSACCPEYDYPRELFRFES